MKAEYVISIYLDTRRKKKNGKYPVKLRVFATTTKMQKLYNTSFEFTEVEFDSIWKTSKTRNENKEVKKELMDIESNAGEIAKTLKPFTFVAFEKRLLRTKGDNSNIVYLYNLAIDKLKANGQIGTADNYSLSLKSIKAYINHKTGTMPEKISFYEITSDFLKGYEKYMVKDLERSRTTVSMYLRALRTIFNTSIRDKDIEQEIYPFGKHKYQVPAVKRVKKAVSNDQLKTIFNTVPNSPDQEKAKAFWFFTYSCNGMNMKDIANLRFKDMKEDTISFFRAKTINTSKEGLKPVTIYLNDFTKEVIEKYGNKKKNGETYIFPIINPIATLEIQHKQVKNFITYVNQHFKKFMESMGINESVTTIWARHSFTTNAIRNGASIEYISEALSHSSPNTTIGYFAGFEDDKKKEISEKLMQF
jgi:integrase/recombinase XerD